jgi:hypothetical protein
MSYYKLEVDYYNSFWIKKSIYTGTPSGVGGGLPYDYGNFATPQQWRGGIASTWPSIPWSGETTGFPPYPSGNGKEPGTVATPPTNTNGFDEQENWFIEASRYQEDFNATSVDYGAKAYLKEDFNKPEFRPNALIYSGVYNSRTGINETNVFSVGETITRAVDPQKGSIQKLYAEDTNLIVFQEDKVNKALIDKDTIYTTEGGTQTLPPGTVIGQLSPYAGEFGISKNPESFAVYGFRKYFADKDRGSILRLSADGITEISEYGMSNFFRDKLKDLNENLEAVDVSAVYANTQDPGGGGIPPYITIVSGPTIPLGSQLIVNGVEYDIYVTGWRNNYVTLSQYPNFTIPTDANLKFRTFERDKILGGWDIHDREYVVSLQKAGNSTFTNQTENYYTLAFDENINGWPTFYSYKPNNIFSLKNTYFTTNSSEIYEHYFTGTPNNRNVFYGAAAAKSSITFVFNPQVNISKSFLTIGYEGSNGWEISSFASDQQGKQVVNDNYINPSPTISEYVNYTDNSVTINSYYEGAYDGYGNEYPAALTPPIYRAGFTLKEGKYVANLKNNSGIRVGEVIYGSTISGIKGYFATVTLQTDSSTDLAGQKQIFAASTNIVASAS